MLQCRRSEVRAEDTPAYLARRLCTSALWSADRPQPGTSASTLLKAASALRLRVFGVSGDSATCSSAAPLSATFGQLTARTIRFAAVVSARAGMISFVSDGVAWRIGNREVSTGSWKSIWDNRSAVPRTALRASTRPLIKVFERWLYTAAIGEAPRSSGLVQAPGAHSPNMWYLPRARFPTAPNSASTSASTSRARPFLVLVSLAPASAARFTSK
jgi:hypothetical protein